MNVLKVQGLTKRYGEKKALDDFSFQINPGKIIGLIGKNGAGKTTLLNCIAGNIFPDSGNIYFDDKDLLVNCEIRKDFGILIQPSFFNYMNTYDNLKLLQNAVGIWDKKLIYKRSNEVLKIVGLENKGKIYVKSFSFGMKQRLGFAQALLNGHKFMILDEPFVGLDINGRELVKEYIKKIVKENNIGVIFSDHNLDEVRSLCKRVIVIKEGKKIYDNNLEEDSYYKIGINNISSELIQAMINMPEVKIEKETSSITFNSKINLHNVLATIMPYVKIKFIKSYENNLENMLKGD